MPRARWEYNGPAMLSFLLELIERAWDSSVASMGTTTLAIGGSLVYPLGDLIRERRALGWNGLQKHWKERLKYSAIIAICWWGLLFSYHLFYKVPQEIRTTASHFEKLFTVSSPKLPDFAFRKPAPRKRGRNIEPFAFTEDIPDTVTILLDNGANMHMTLNLKSEAIQKDKFSGLLELDGERPLTVYIQDRTFYVDASITDGSGHTAIQIKKNKFEVKPAEWDRNFSPNAVEIVDSIQRPMFQMIRKRANLIQINGLFVSSKGSIFDIRPPKALFKYPAWKYLGKYSEESLNVTSPPTPVRTGGNLKQRTLDLCQAITKGMAEREEYVSAGMPNSPEKPKTMALSLSNWFRWKFLPDVRSLHEELAELHIRNNDLDKFFKYEDMEADAERRMAQLGVKQQRGPRTLSWYDWNKIIEHLTSMAEQLKD